MEIRQTELKDMQFREAENKNPILSGYFVRFDDVYTICDGITESIAKGAFDESINDDVRALFNHNTDLVLGRTSSNTLRLTQDEFGLYGEIEINVNDSMARDVYERIKRGDVSGCSFGFDIESETYDIDAKGNVHWTINRVKPLYEVSPCTFPAYQNTSISSRTAESMKHREEQTKQILMEKRNAELLEWKTKLYKKLGVENA